MAKHAYQQMLPARSHLKWNQTTKHGCLKWNSGTTSRSNCQLNTCYPFSENSTKSDSKCSQNTMFIGNNLQCKMYLQWLWFLVADLKSWQFQTRVFVEVLKSMRLGQGIVSCRSTGFRGKLLFQSITNKKKIKTPKLFKVWLRLSSIDFWKLNAFNFNSTCCSLRRLYVLSSERVFNNFRCFFLVDFSFSFDPFLWLVTSIE